MEFGELEAEWHPTLNLPLLFNGSLVGNRKYWWLGKCNHTWEAVFRKRAVENSGCPICSGRRVLSGFNDLATLNPKLAAEWHPTKNEKVSATEIASQSNLKVWWLGTCGHEWEATVNSRHGGKGCCFCSNKKILLGFNDLVTTHPDLAAEWHPTKNGNVKPDQVSAGSGFKVWWLGICGHEWNTSLVKRKSGTKCPFCSNNQILTGFNDLASTHPLLAGEWHPTKNGQLKPTQVISGSIKRYWWLGSCGHEWEAGLHSRVLESSCPFCSNQRVLAGFNDLTTTNPVIATEWHPTKNGSYRPEQVMSGSIKKYWWLGSCGHEWEASLHHRSGRKQGCPFCNNQRVLAGFNDLATTHPLITTEFHPTKNGQSKVTQIISGSDKNYWWKCTKDHEWKASPYNRTKGGTGCPHCWVTTYVSKAEQEIYDYICSIDGAMQVIQSDRQLLLGKELDIYIPSRKIAVEFNGIYWHSEKTGRKPIDYHHNKYLAAQKAGIQLVQLWEDDWTTKPEVVKSILKQKLGVAEKVLAVDTEVITVTKEQAEEFLRETHLQGYASGTHYLGLVSKGDIETLRAIMVLEDESEKVLNIVRYATSANVVGGFTKLLDHATKTFNHDSFTATSDHCEANEEIYENNGFIVEAVLPPDYMYVVKNERKLRSEYPLERFRDDPKLLWEEGLTERELADLNGLDRIWDAGKTRYRLIVGK